MCLFLSNKSLLYIKHCYMCNVELHFWIDCKICMGGAWGKGEYNFGFFMDVFFQFSSVREFYGGFYGCFFVSYVRGGGEFWGNICVVKS